MEGDFQMANHGEKCLDHSPLNPRKTCDFTKGFDCLGKSWKTDGFVCACYGTFIYDRVSNSFVSSQNTTFNYFSKFNSSAKSVEEELGIAVSNFGSLKNGSGHGMRNAKRILNALKKESASVKKEPFVLYIRTTVLNHFIPEAENYK